MSFDQVFSRMFGHAKETIEYNKLVKQFLDQMELSILTDLRQQIDRMIIGIRLNEPAMNPFTILGVDAGVTEDGLKEAYRKRARETHPDAGGSQEEFVKVQAAYETIKRFKGWG